MAVCRVESVWNRSRLARVRTSGQCSSVDPRLRELGVGWRKEGGRCHRRRRRRRPEEVKVIKGWAFETKNKGKWSFKPVTTYLQIILLLAK